MKTSFNPRSRCPSSSSATTVARLLDRRGVEPGQQGRDVGHPVPGEYSGVRRVDPHDGLVVEVLRDVGDEPVRADRDHHVAGREPERGQVGPVDPTQPPARGHRGDHGVEGAAPSVVAGLEFGELVGVAVAQEELHRARRAVPVEQLAVRAGSGHHDHPGFEAHAVGAGRCAARPGRIGRLLRQRTSALRGSRTTRRPPVVKPARRGTETRRHGNGDSASRKQRLPATRLATRRRANGGPASRKRGLAATGTATRLVMPGRRSGGSGG